MGNNHAAKQLVPALYRDSDRSQVVLHDGGMRDSFGHNPLPEPSLLDYWSLVRKRYKLVLASTCIFFAISAVYCFFSTSLYTSDTTIEIRGHAPVLANVQSEMLFGNDTRKIEYQKTTVAKLELEGLADEVLSKDDLARDLQTYFEGRRTLLDKAQSKVMKLFGSSAKSSLLNDRDSHFIHKPKVIRKYLNLIDINPVHETNLVGIAVTTADPALSQRIANAHALGFIEHLQRERQDSIASNLLLLQRQAAELKDRVTNAEKALSDYAGRNKLISLSEQQGNTVVLRQIEELATMLAGATSKRVKSESALGEAKQRGLSESSAFDDDSIRQLRSTLLQAEAEYATLGQKVTPEYPEMQELRAKIDVLKKSIADQRKRIEKSLQSTYDSDTATEQKLRAQIALETENAQEMSKRLIEYNVLYKEAASLRDLYQAVLKQVKEIEISAASTTSNVFVSDFATFPTEPSAPKSGLVLTLFTVLGFAAGIALCVVLEALDKTMKTTEEVQNALDLPVLGIVPRFSNESASTSSKRFGFLPWKRTGNDDGSKLPVPSGEQASTIQDQVLSISPPQDAVGEALRTIRASILLSSADNPPRVVMVTSAMKGEGKTTIVSNLAVTLAQASHRTLIIDGDLRMSRLATLFGMKPFSTGLSDLLTGQAALDQVIRTTTVPGLDVLLAGHKAPNPAELVGSQAMGQLIQDLLARYDFLLIDAPPVLPVSDALVLSRLVDSVVIVARSNVTERKMAQETRRRLLRVNARVLGVVFNDLDPAHASNYEAALYGQYVDDADLQKGTGARKA